MRVCPLSTVKSHIVLGAPLPFSVRGADRTLLLARGQMMHDEAQLAELLQRGALVEADELATWLQGGAQPVAASLNHVPVERLPALWDSCSDDVRRALAAPAADFHIAFTAASGLLQSLIDRAPNVALAQVVRHQSTDGTHYGVVHSMNAATACLSATRLMGWSTADQQRAFQATLTMNLSMLDLQARLATQVSPLTGSQRSAIQEHPTRTAEMLAQAGVSDTLWLDAVAQHHEQPDGSGYPSGRSDVCELAEVLRYADVYTALLSARSTRPAISAQQASRELFQMGSDRPLCQAVIKSFGIFPPGSCVRLASGELGVVKCNGEKAYHPQVAALTTADGSPRRASLLRDAARAEHAVVAVLPLHAMPMRLTAEAVAALIAA